jgi:XTP/dITP diphosphohydrolase
MTDILYVATANRHKLEEIATVLEPMGVQVRACRELGAVEVLEDGATFLDNARKKARAYLPRTDQWVLADDSGLEVDALGGEPGVRSARYALPQDGQTPDQANNAKLLSKLNGVAEADRQARFVCAMVLGRGGREVLTTRGVAEGRILAAARGEGGFGYDPLFFHPPSGRTFAELDRDAKNRVSHRGLALEKIAAFLRARGTAQGRPPRLNEEHA